MAGEAPGRREAHQTFDLTLTKGAQAIRGHNERPRIYFRIRFRDRRNLGAVMVDRGKPESIPRGFVASMVKLSTFNGIPDRICIFPVFDWIWSIQVVPCPASKWNHWNGRIEFSEERGNHDPAAPILGLAPFGMR